MVVMDKIVKKIYEYSKELMGNKLDEKSIEEIKKRIADSIIVSFGSKDSQPVKIEKESLLPSKGPLNSRIYFTNTYASAETATFINGSMTRYLDYNDTYLSKEALHPSDNIPPIFAISEALNIGGLQTILAIGVAYQVIGALADAVSIRDRGWDHVTYISISSAAGIASLMNLDSNKFENAINLGINNNISMRQTRAGELSMWKGCTAADASRNSVFAAILAKKGFTGPSPIFEGEMGFFKQVSGGFDLNLGENRIIRTMIKNYPVEYHAMSAAEAAVNLKNRIVGNIKSIEVETFKVAHNIIIKDPEKLRPKTKETADHSMPYIIGYALNYGAPNLDTYSDKFLKDKKILSLIDKMHFVIADRFDKIYPEYLPVKIRITTDSDEYVEEIHAPKGHYKNPYSWDDLRIKGNLVMGEDNSKMLVEFVKQFEKKSVKELMDVIENVNIKR
jgi:2-methylcitrate dehydratase